MIRKLKAAVKRYFSATRQEWPYAFFSRNILMLGLAACALCATPLVNPPIPSYEELRLETGTYQGLERRSDDSYLLSLTTEGGYTDLCLIDSFAPFDRYAFLAAVRPGDPVTLRYGPDEYRTVMELTAAGTEFLTYDRTRQAAWRNKYLALIVSASATAALMGLCWGAVRLRKPRQAEPREMPVSAAVPSGYTREERAEVETYIQRAYGKPGRVYYDATRETDPVDIAVIPPTERENFYRLVTIGMGGRRMNVPPELRETNRAFAELAVFLPPDWDPDGGDLWPFRWLRRAAEADWLRPGTVFSGRIGGYTALLVSWPVVREDCTGRVILENSKIINFYQLYPLLPDEDDYRKLRGVRRLWDRMQEFGVSPIVTPTRESCCVDWFDRDIAPFAVEEKDGVWYGWLQLKGSGPCYREPVYPRDAEGWRTLCRRFCEKYGWQGPALHVQENIFYITAADEDTLRPFLLAFHDFCDVPEQVAALLEEAQ